MIDLEIKSSSHDVCNSSNANIIYNATDIFGLYSSLLRQCEALETKECHLALIQP